MTHQAAPEGQGDRLGSTNGSAMAAVVAAGIGSFAMGAVVIAGELGLSVPALYAPAGGVSGRTTLAAVVWLVAWAALHARWKQTHVDAQRVHAVTLLLVVLGLVLTFPPVWGLFP